MKTTELRIGNIVTVDNPKYHPQLKSVLLRVVGIQENVIADKIEHCLQLEHINKKANTYNQTYSQFMEYIKPVALTEQWLLDFGFKENEYGNMSLFKEFEYLEIMCGRGDFYPSYEQPTEFAHEENRVVSLKQIKYVHQLQNLYFALMQEELILKTK